MAPGSSRDSGGSPSRRRAAAGSNGASSTNNGNSDAAKKNTSPYLTKTRWFNNILGQAVDAVQEEDVEADSDLQMAEDALEAQEDLDMDDYQLPLAFSSARHLEEIEGMPLDEATQAWRMRERMKTVSVALVVCLNVGVDPPDVKKTEPCARVECWINPQTLNSQKALEAIGSNLQKQYERWQPRARYRQSLDPTVEEVRRLATGLRRNARDERVLFHYNGHGVPKPTANGEIWVFNRSYTQYIPLSLYDLQGWMGSPSIFVYDCSNAGIIVTSFEQFAEQHEREYHEQVASQGVAPGQDLAPPISPRNCIQLAACGSDQLLPMNPELPADLFTACLTTPIKMALRWFVMQNQGTLAPRISIDMLEKIPGQFGDRRTMLGELNWIFTAITDTIAWNTLPRSLFQKLFRQDLLVASLFRNFLLAERVMRSYDCTPVSAPSLPSTHQHTMWQAWDLAVDMALTQLPAILEKGVPYTASTFFEEQLTAFEVWLRYGDEKRPPPEQLPIVLQVLLSQAHRLRALDLLGTFLDLGPWAVNLALSVGIFPYVLKLLQASARELRPLLVSIWAKILAVDTSCQADLVRDNSHRYFISVLQDDCMMPNHHTWAAFILASIVNNFRQGQQEAEKGNLIAICLEHLNDPEPVLRQWLAIALGRVWNHYEPARWRGARDNAHEKLYELLKDDIPEVRAAAVFALGTFVNSCDERTEHANSLDHSIALNLLKTVLEDGSHLVRQELVLAFQHVVYAFESNFVNACRNYMKSEEAAMSRSTEGISQTNPGTTRGTTSPSPGGGAAVAPGLKRSMNSSSLQASSSSPALDRLGAHHGQVRNTSFNSLSMLSSALPSVGSVYEKVYRALEFLSLDAHHFVSGAAYTLVAYLRLRVRNKEALSRPALSINAPVLENVFSTNTTSSSSVPNSPAKLQQSYLGGGGSSNLNRSLHGVGDDGAARPLRDAAGVATIKEEAEGATTASTAGTTSPSASGSSPQKQGGPRPPPPNSSTHPRLSRGGSVGRHPSGQHNNPKQQQQQPLHLQQSQSANVSLQAYSSVPRPDIETEFIPWSAKFFTKQLMRHDCVECDCDHESTRHWSREWMYTNNANVKTKADYQYSLLRNHLVKLDGPVSTSMGGTTSVIKCEPQTASTVAFHPFSPMLVAAGQNIISVWNISPGSLGRLNYIDLACRARLNLSSLEMINAHDDTVLLASGDNGSVLVFRDFVDNKRMKHVAAWNGLRELDPQRKFQPLSASAAITASTTAARSSWCQLNSTLALGADSRFVRLWDARKELKKYDIETEDFSGAVTSLEFVQGISSSMTGVLVTGFTSGNVKLFDIRSWSRSPILSLSELEGAPILDALIQDTSAPMLVSGNAGGIVRLYDLRKPFNVVPVPKSNFGTINLGQNSVRMAIHPRTGLLASWTPQQTVSVHTFDQMHGSSAVNVVKNHEEGMLGLRLGAEGGSLKFHPYLLQLGIASREGAISVKGPRKTI